MKRQLWLIMLNLMFLYGAQSSVNRLVHEDSPYLKQHAHNPVDWYPWSDEAFAKARSEKKMIFLSIGYSTCHWCHVMEEESFTDQEVAKLLNDHFVAIKVDREEYPQIDKKYQRFYTALHGKRGGWPLSVFLSAEGEVIDLRTYIPKEDGYGSEGLMKLLPSLIRLQQNPLVLQKRINANRLKMLVSQKLDHPTTLSPEQPLKKRVMDAFGKVYDTINGGFATHPKFPEASRLTLLLDIYRLYDEKKALQMAEATLRRMAQGGIYDQIGGGFFRYVTDERWLIPHFEKMLYTNAQMIEVYADAYLLTGEPLYKKIVTETIAAMREHYEKDGLFLGASDADSNGVEGGYFIYDHDKIKKNLLQKGWDRAELEEALAYLGIEEDGNIDGEFSLAHITSKEPPSKAEALKAYLKSLRRQRTFPFVDTKINTAWNAMMIKALFEASKIDKQYQKMAEGYMQRLWKRMRRGGILYHQGVPGKRPKQEALLEDYAYLLDALIAGYERNYDPLYLERAKLLAQEAISKFKKETGWYLSDDKIGALADHDDRYYTSSLSTLWGALLDLASLREDLGLYAQISQEINAKESLLYSRPLYTAKLVELYMRLKHADVVIHAPREKLLIAQKQIDHIRYPYVLSKVQASNAYLACRISNCFASDSKIEKLIEKIEHPTAIVEKKGISTWQKR